MSVSFVSSLYVSVTKPKTVSIDPTYSNVSKVENISGNIRQRMPRNKQWNRAWRPAYRTFSDYDISKSFTRYRTRRDCKLNCPQFGSALLRPCTFSESVLTDSMSYNPLEFESEQKSKKNYELRERINYISPINVNTFLERAAYTFIRDRFLSHFLAYFPPIWGQPRNRLLSNFSTTYAFEFSVGVPGKRIIITTIFPDRRDRRKT